MIKTHQFKLGKYRILWYAIEACCEVPDEGDKTLAIMTPPVTDFHTFSVALHEAEHADGLPDKVIHDAEGYPVHGGRHRFAWRILQEMLKTAEEAR
jgi:hypothetical protein